VYSICFTVYIYNKTKPLRDLYKRAASSAAKIAIIPPKGAQKNQTSPPKSPNVAWGVFFCFFLVWKCVRGAQKSQTRTPKSPNVAWGVLV
jgi:hypothetical protein